jgi:hypothetical protein
VLQVEMREAMPPFPVLAWCLILITGVRIHTVVLSYARGNCILNYVVILGKGILQKGPKKCTHSLSAAITPDTLTAVFAQQFGGIDAV